MEVSKETSMPKSGPCANLNKLDISLWGVFRPYLLRGPWFNLHDVDEGFD